MAKTFASKGRKGRALANVKKQEGRQMLRASHNKNNNVSLKTNEERQQMKRDREATKELEQQLLNRGKEKRVLFVFV